MTGTYNELTDQEIECINRVFNGIKSTRLMGNML